MTDSEEREWERGDDDRFGGEGVGEGGMMTDSEEREWERGMTDSEREWEREG